ERELDCLALAFAGANGQRVAGQFAAGFIHNKRCRLEAGVLLGIEDQRPVARRAPAVPECGQQLARAKFSEMHPLPVKGCRKIATPRFSPVVAEYKPAGVAELAIAQPDAGRADQTTG